MGVLDFLRPTRKGQPQIADLESSLARLRVELNQARDIIEGHGQRRASMLLTDASDHDIAKLAAEVDLAQIRVERLGLAELELIDRIDRARDLSDRNRRAVEAERAADRIEEATKALEASVATLGECFAQLVAALPQRTGLERRHVGQQFLGSATPDEVARAILATALYSVAPGAFETGPSRRPWSGGAAVERELLVYVQEGDVLSERLLGFNGEGSKIPTASIAAEEMIIGRLRAEAATLREPITEPPVAAE